MATSDNMCRTATGWDINGFGQLKDGRGNICPVTIIMPTLAMEAKEKSIDLIINGPEDGTGDKNYNLIGVYESSRIAQEKTGCDQASIIRCINGKAKTCGGYKWILYEDYFKLTINNKDYTK